MKTMTKLQERNGFAKMTDTELEAYQHILGYAKNTIYVDPDNQVQRHRGMVAEEIAGREGQK